MTDSWIYLETISNIFYNVIYCDSINQKDDFEIIRESEKIYLQNIY